MNVFRILDSGSRSWRNSRRTILGELHHTHKGFTCYSERVLEKERKRVISENKRSQKDGREVSQLWVADD